LLVQYILSNCRVVFWENTTLFKTKGLQDMGVRRTVAVLTLCRTQVVLLLHLTEKIQNYLSLIAIKCRTRIAERGITTRIWKAEN
jgi:hypothetical protein